MFVHVVIGCINDGSDTVDWSVDCYLVFFFFQAEDGIRDLVRSRGLGDVYKRQVRALSICASSAE